MEIKFTPKVVTGYEQEEVNSDGLATGKMIPVAPTFEGHLMIQMPSFPERMRFPKEIGIGSVQLSDSEDEAKRKIEDSMNNMEVLAKASEKIQGYIKEVNLKHLKSGTEIKSVEQLYCDPIAGVVLVELATEFISGFSSKNS